MAKVAQAAKVVPIVKAVETAKPVGSNEAIEAAKPIGVAKPVEAAKPVEPAKPVQVAKPVPATQPIAAPKAVEKPVAAAKVEPPKVVEAPRVIPLPEPPPEPTSPLDAVIAAQDKAGGPEAGAFSSVADALRAWSAEVVQAGDDPPVSAPAWRRPSMHQRQRLRSTMPGGRCGRISVGATCRFRSMAKPRSSWIVSSGGAQIVTAAMLKPGRQVKLTFPTIGAGLIGKGKIVWSRLEPPSTGHGVLQYRAGVAFSNIAPQVLEKLVKG